MINEILQVKIIRNYCSRLNLSENCVRKIEEICDTFLKKKYMSNSGVNPRTFLAGAIYISSAMCRESRTEEDVANALGTTPASLRKGKAVILDELKL